MDTLQAIKLFVRTVEAGSISAAARHHGLSPATGSRYLHKLEQQVGNRLLNRNSRELSLTEAGERYYRMVAGALVQLDEASREATRAQEAVRGTLRVHARHTVAQLIISPALPRFLRRYPELAIDLLVSNRANPNLVGDNIDIDVQIGALKASALIAKRLTGESKNIICASSEYLAASPPLRQPADLAGHNCMIYQVGSRKVVWRFRSHKGEIEEVAPRGNLRSDNGIVLLNYVRSGGGIGIIPTWAVADDLRSGRLVTLLADYAVAMETFEATIHALYPRNRRGSPAVRAFIDFFSNELRAPG